MGSSQGAQRSALRENLRITIDDITFTINYTLADTPASIEKSIKATLPLLVPYLSTDVTDDGTVTIVAISKRGDWKFFFQLRLTKTLQEASFTIAITGLTSNRTTNGTAIGPANYSALFTSLPDVQYNLIVASFASADLANKLRGELADRFGPLRQKDGVALLTVTSSAGNIPVGLKDLNSQFITVLTPGDSPTPAYLFGAATAGQITASASIDPARPFQTLELQGRFAPPRTKPTFSERNNLLRSGISTIAFDQSDTPKIERIVTTYQRNAAGAEDRSYHDSQHPADAQLYQKRFPLVSPEQIRGVAR